jgi:hemerythrin
MHQIKWKEEYMTGIEKIDKQHQEFVKLINSLNIIQGYGDNLEYALRLMTEVGKYADYHFACEENLMYLTKYPHRERQQKEHMDILQEYRQLMQDYQDNKATIEDVIKYLEGWFAKHVVDEDKKIGEYLQQQKK